MNKQSTIWGFYPGYHEGAGGDFSDGVFFREGLVGIGWPLTGSLANLVKEGSDVSAFVRKIRGIYENHEDIPTWTEKKREKWFRDSAGVLHRFLCEAQPEDIIVYACKNDQQVYIGRIKDTAHGRYKYTEGNQLHWHCRHFREVEWLSQIPYEHCSKQELAQIRTQNKFWRMKACPEKFVIGL